MAGMQEFTELDQWREPLERMRAWVLAGVERQDDAFLDRWNHDWATKVGVVAAYLEPGQLRPDETWKLQALGVVLGDAMALRTAARWVELHDEQGTDPCLWLGTSDTKLVFPMTMIAKRVESGATLTVQDLIGMVDFVAEAALEPRGVAEDSPSEDGLGRRVARLVHRLRR